MASSGERESAVRAQVKADNAKMKEGLAVFFLGRTCPLSQQECLGPECPWFLVNGEQQGNKRIITGGNCAVPLLASQAGPMADGLARLATVAATPAAPLSQIIPVKR